MKGARVTSNSHAELFDAANCAGITPNEFIITNSAEKLSRSGAPFAGVFCRGEARAIFKAIARGKSVGSSRRSILERLGIMAQGDIQHVITSLSSPANSPLTIKLKGSSNPMIDTGEMRPKVTYKVDDGE